MESGDIRVCVMGAFERSIGGGFDGTQLSYICESITVDIEDNGIPKNATYVLDSYTDLFLTYGEVDNEELISFCTILLTELQRIEEELLKQGEEEGCDGGCELCQRFTFLTRHHLIPRETHKHMKKKGLTLEELCKCILICRQCHSAIHHFISNKEMAQYYHTLDRLLENEQVQAYVNWNSKQKVASRRFQNGVKQIDDNDD
eukprot:TRINITY_DN1576_c0_g1_i10.p3 TRINITY_DN1576_c0_g1~~TRINITY_DN1576_c0_g1_i10.p3  ORF type:complete len:202 (+),score=23.31 TRINITY_DN1576_c0_g1_i10:278-883(+)